MNSTAQSTQDRQPPVEVFANGGRVWLAGCADCTVWASFRTPEEVDELIAAMDAAKRQAWPELKTDDTE